MTRGHVPGTELDTFLTPENVIIVGRRECGEWMTGHGYPAEDVEKIWKFSWNCQSNQMMNYKGRLAEAAVSRLMQSDSSDSEAE